MTDKLRRTAPVQITIADGESPSGAKLSAINNQVRKALNVIEKAVGDLWNQSGDSLMYNYPLQIPNLARLIGEHKYINPCLFPVTEDFSYTDNIGAKFPNQNEIYLQFNPKTLASITVTAGTTLTSRKDNQYEVDATGDYWVDLTTGKLISFDALAAADEIKYTVDSSAWAVQDTTLPGVIPDPRQNSFTGCRISTAGGNYYIHLSPRMPLSLDFDGGSFDGWSLPDRYPSSSDLTDNYDSSIPAGTKKLWQNPSSSALNDAYYRYSLPKEITDNLAGMSVGDTLPQGFLYLWDRTSGTIIADAEFRKSSYGDWVFQISSNNVDFSSKVTSTEAEASYNNTNYSVIAVGTPIARSIWTLSNTMLNHTHGNDGDFSSLMEHSKLINLNPPPSSYSGHGGRYPSTVPAWAPSRWAQDDHISLLSRAGSQGTAGGDHRDVNDNAMLGHLIMGAEQADGGTHLNSVYDSYKIYFGAIGNSDCPYIYAPLSSLDNALMISASYLGIGGAAPDSNAMLNLSNGSSSAAYGILAIGMGGIVGFYYDGSGQGILVSTNASDAAIDGSNGGGDGIWGRSTSPGSRGVYGISTTGPGVEGVSASNYGVVAQGDTTSPTTAAFRIVPQNAAPTGPNLVGDVYMSTAGKMYACTVAGTPGTWQLVGAQT